MVPEPRAERRALLITGTVGAGKTTVADLLSDRLAESGVPHAVVDLDRLCQFWPPPADDPFNFELQLRNLRALARNHFEAGARRLVLAGVVERHRDRERYRAAVGAELSVCRLTAAPAVLRERLIRRHHDDADGLRRHLRRAGELTRVLDRARPEDFRVDTTGRPAAVVAAAVSEAVGRR
ncbi:AAA family ATPase [Streptomyces alkaliterrae]|uniref:AAA family ATPase n=1 Tax=Streptomyces alkaliterrae TaxID=2213162 RepID=A0A5P0YV41_9ACTN|nr:AAA family ATPase [Streptomyces alkaliterrae]MBB1262061.1 AAA family ATPase [Streptomyces alkaliterrae]MQS04165.1 AAA family ATPase [Streptomyces alkaliterrae]